MLVCLNVNHLMHHGRCLLKISESLTSTSPVDDCASPPTLTASSSKSDLHPVAANEETNYMAAGMISFIVGIIVNAKHLLMLHESAFKRQEQHDDTKRQRIV